MTNNIDMSKTIAPKSDQMNYDDFITGPKTVTITGVKSTANVNDQQPVSVHYQGDAGKPYKPCKSMRRVMVKVWGNEGAEYVGKSMTLFGDQNVIYAGQAVGGIRISHMSHIDKDINISLSASKTKRVLYRVKPLRVDMVDVEDNYPELYKRGQIASDQGLEAYQEFFMSLNAHDKAKLNDKGDHAGFKVVAASVNTPTEETSGFPGDDNYKPE